MVCQLNASDMEPVELSIDSLGKIYFYRNRILRVINNNYIRQVKHMFDSGFIDEIVNKGLFPNTWISDIKLASSSLVLEHENICHWNYPYEWSFDMLKDAALLILQLNEIANKYGYEIKDGHAYNVVYKMNKPCYIDFGSFIKINEEDKFNWESYEIFYSQFYIPLYLWSKGYTNIARNIFLMRNYFNGEEFFKFKYPLINILSNRYISTIYYNIAILRKVCLLSKNEINMKVSDPFKRCIALVINRLLRKKFAAEKFKTKILRLKKEKKVSMWSNYHDNIDIGSNKRISRITEIINRLRDASSLIELGANQGKIASYIMEKTHITKIIATDYDEEAVNTMYLHNKKRDNFLPLLVDIVRTDGRIYDRPIKDRLKCDIVMALALTHHLILSQGIHIEYIFKSMKNLTNKYIIVEFMPLGLYSGDLNKIPPLPDFYNYEWFKRVFTMFFDLILDENLELNRHVFLGKLKN